MDRIGCNESVAYCCQVIILKGIEHWPGNMRSKWIITRNEFNAISMKLPCFWNLLYKLPPSSRFSISKIQTSKVISQAMTFLETSILVLLFAALSATSQRVCDPVCQAKEPFNCNNPQTFNQSDFAKNFTFGAATSAYQVWSL